MSKKKASTPTFTTIGPTVITIGELMDATESDKTKIVNIPLKPSGCSLARLMREGKTNQPTKTPPELSDMDGLMRRVNKHYGKRLRDGGLLMAMAAVAEFKGWLIHQVRKMTIAEFNAALDEAMGRRQYGPDPHKQILYWDGTAYPLTRKNWEFLSTVWGRYNVPFYEIGEKVWGDNMTSSGTIRQLILRVNHQLEKYHINLLFTSEGEQVSPLSNWPM